MAVSRQLTYREAEALVHRVAVSPHVDLLRLSDGLARQAQGLLGKEPVAARNSWLLRNVVEVLAQTRAPHGSTTTAAAAVAAPPASAGSARA